MKEELEYILLAFFFFFFLQMLLLIRFLLLTSILLPPRSRSAPPPATVIRRVSLRRHFRFTPPIPRRRLLSQLRQTPDDGNYRFSAGLGCLYRRRERGKFLGVVILTFLRFS